MDASPKKNKPGQGRKKEGRIRKNVLMLPAGWAALEAQKRGTGDTLGKVVERLLGVADEK